jgi:hypothetical protein
MCIHQGLVCGRLLYHLLEIQRIPSLILVSKALSDFKNRSGLRPLLQALYGIPAPKARAVTLAAVAACLPAASVASSAAAFADSSGNAAAQQLLQLKLLLSTLP